MKKKCIASILIVIILLSGCSNTNKTIETPELLKPVSVNIDTSIVKYDEIYKLTAYNAQIVPYTEELSFAVSGRIGELNVNLGDTVEKGQVLVALEENDLKSQIETLEATITNAKKANEYSNAILEYDLEILRLELEPLEESLKNTLKKEAKELQFAIDIKKADIKIAETKLSQALKLQEYELSQSEEELTSLKSDLGQNTITAPFSGQIVYLADLAEQSSVVADRVIITIADSSRPRIKSDYMNESILEESNEYYAMIGDKKYDITFVPKVMDEYLKIILAGGTPTSLFTIDNLDTDISIGDYASIGVISNYIENTLVVPIDSIYKDTDGSYVYLMDGDARIRQSVTVGVKTDSLAEISDGLKEGDNVYVKN